MEREQTPEQIAQTNQMIKEAMQYQAKLEAEYQDMVEGYKQPKVGGIGSYILTIIATIIIVKLIEAGKKEFYPKKTTGKISDK